jgi:DNA-binding GntR family transcriptional regulator
VYRLMMTQAYPRAKEIFEQDVASALIYLPSSSAMVDQCMSEYDLDGWTVPDLVNNDDVRSFGQNSSPHDHVAMERGLQRMNNSAEDPREFFEANVEFHRAIAHSTGVTVLIAIYDSLVTVLTGALVRAVWTAGHEQTIDHNLRVHAQILESIRAKDRKRLETATRLHRVDMISLAQPEKSPVAHLEQDPSGGVDATEAV